MVIAILVAIAMINPSYADTTVFHSQATLQAEQRGLTVIDGWLCWADNGQEVEVDSNGFMPYEEFYYIEENNGAMPSDVTYEMKVENSLYYDYHWGKTFHDKWCSIDHSKKATPTKKVVKKVKKKKSKKKSKKKKSKKKKK